jgi:hypothetical protein
MNMAMNQGGMMNNPNVNQLQMNYYNQSQFVNKLPNVDNILFVADLPDETCEEDLANFFKAYNFCLAKLFQ